MTLLERKAVFGFCILMIIVVSGAFAQTTKEKIEKKIESKVQLKLEGLEGLQGMESLRGLEGLQGLEGLSGSLENLEINLEGLELGLQESRMTTFGFVSRLPDTRIYQFLVLFNSMKTHRS